MSSTGNSDSINTKDGNSDNKDTPNSNRNDIITINRSTFTKLAVVGIAALMIASFFGGYTFRTSFYPNIGGPTLVAANGNGLQLQPQITKVASVDTDGAPTKGKSDAPVTMVEFADFQCPFCGKFASDTLQQLVKNYVDTGQVKFVYDGWPADSTYSVPCPTLTQVYEL